MNGRTALVLIDGQVNMFDPLNPVSEAKRLLTCLTKLVARSRAAKVPIVFVRNCGGIGDPDERGTPGWQLHPDLQPAPGDLVVDKTTGNTFASTQLDERLRALGVSHLIIAGLQSEFCVRDTALGALSGGYEVTLVSDAHSTYDGDGQTAQEISSTVNAEMQDRVTLRREEELQLQ